MKIVFGQHAGGSWPEQVLNTGGIAGQAVAGPSALLGLVETHLGLLSPAPEPALRLLRYAGRLRACGPDRFWSASLAVDDLGTAAAVLSLRDELVAGGWDGQAGAGAPERIRDLAAAEGAKGSLPAGEADRARAVLAALADKGVPISELRVGGEPGGLPPPWPGIIAALRDRGVPVLAAEGPSPAATGDLGALQRFLEDGKTAAPAGDGSLIVLRAPSDAEAAEVLAARLAGGAEGMVLIAGEDETLDGALRAHGVPAAGTAAGSRLRPAMQALRLALAVRWEPVDPRRLLELLVLPGGPVARAAAGKLAAALREQPGMGKAWAEALKTSGAEGWFGPERWSNAMPAAAAAKIANKVAAWAGRDSDADPVKAAAAGASARFAELVDARGGDLSRVALERLLDVAAGEGVAAPGRFAQAGHVARVAHPGAILGEAESVIWWSFSADDAPAAPRSPWSRAEREWFARAGVELEDPGKRARRDAEAMLAPVRYAMKTLVLVVADRRAGVEAAPHPVLDRVRAAFGENLSKLEVASGALLGRSARFLGAPLRGGAVAPRALPRRKRWWALPENSIPAREVESYSSLENFLHRPFQWVLRYPARIQAGELGGLPEGNLLLGSLAEALIADVAGDDAFVAKAGEAAVRRRVEAKMPGLLAESGAVLLQPGFELERERLRAASVRTAWTLAQAMRAGGWRRDEAREVAGAFCGGKLAGVADLVLVRAKAPSAVLDLKWGGRTYRWKLLKENRALQLAVYARCLRVKGGPAPFTGFLIIESAEILTTDAEAFPGATAVAAPAGDLWGAFETTWKWRRAQLARGRVEVVVEGTEPDQESEPPAGAMALDGDTPFNDYVHLIGFPEGA